MFPEILNPQGKEIAVVLTEIGAKSTYPRDVFSDWLSLCRMSLEQLPKNARLIANGERDVSQLNDSDPEHVKEEFQRIHSKHEGVFDKFALMFGLLLVSAEESWDDVLGDIYQAINAANKWAGQYFTPKHVAELMARTMNIEEDIYSRLEDAYSQTMAGRIHGYMGSHTPRRGFIKSLGEGIMSIDGIAEGYTPLTLMDPCCGSGVMFLAAAKIIPPWMLNWGLIRFYGQDIDSLCVKMAQVNLMLHGMNGYSLQCVLAMSGIDISKLPESVSEQYIKAQKNPEQADEIRAEVQAWSQARLI